MIKLKNLKKAYNENKQTELVVLDDCNIEIEKGDKIIITGENGVGKTTFLKILGLLDKNYSGEYFINGKDISNLSTTEIARLRNEVFGFFFQEYNLLEDETTFDNIVIPLIYSKKYKRSERKQRIREVCRNLEIENLLRQKVKTLSGGEKQRVAIARAIVNDPDIIILDEPTSALSSKLKLKAINYIKKIIGNEKTLIVVTHDLNIVDNLRQTSEYIHYNLEDGKFKRDL
ncbi:MAG: ABC transporter ATP-binding protein [Peptoniphilaceae bacterium]|uniref:ABC transporter ATP-binding protein n=1 Tax=Parvimonas sp. TaxID=1944660 RepID=UPI0025FE632F|nr:ABC transporter ATP-binding protein [Parvimonas sp.]MCI5997174.1 ABC transporter ATP-binding protein [Parvimonas sp.]MDD7764267.1 ABC transporter ATP-binding protein [Peptoniphilaceae bacterium]MDY3051530.1 ABC transporter ATP-binding protein [Parvimonas sp.]